MANPVIGTRYPAPANFVIGPTRLNPVIFSKKYAEELLNLSGDVGGRQVMERHKEDVRFFEIEDEKELFDIDKKEQLEDNRRNV